MKNDYQSENDARTMSDHAEIASDPKRHAAAVRHLKKKAKHHKHALELAKHVKKGLKKAFPKEGSPKEEANEPKAEAMAEGD